MAFAIFQVFCVKAVLEEWLAACIDSVPAEMRGSVHPKKGFEPWSEYYTVLVVCYCLFSWLPVLIDSSVSERFSGLFFIVWDFNSYFPPPPQILLWWRGIHRFIFPSAMPLPSLNDPSILWFPGHPAVSVRQNVFSHACTLFLWLGRVYPHIEDFLADK